MNLKTRDNMVFALPPDTRPSGSADIRDILLYYVRKDFCARMGDSVAL